MTLDVPTLHHLRSLLDALDNREAVAVVDDLLTVAPILEGRAAEAPRRAMPPGGKVYTAQNLRGAFFAIWRRLFGKVDKAGEAFDSKSRRVACLRHWWGIESARDLTDEHANGTLGVVWLTTLAMDPVELHYEIHAAIKADLARPTAAEMEAM